MTEGPCRMGGASRARPSYRYAAQVGGLSRGSLRAVLLARHEAGATIKAGFGFRVSRGAARSVSAALKS